MAQRRAAKKKELEEYDELVYIPLSSGLSSSCQTATMLAADDYEGKVFVVNNQRISVTMRQSVLDAVEMRDKGQSPQSHLIPIKPKKIS